MTDDTAPPRIDGRTARAERTRKAIVDAHFALLQEGDLRPTGERIADRAGVSLRALWTNFKDMETLFAAAGERMAAEQDAAFRPVPPDLPLLDRISEYCQQRGRNLELIGPSARASQIREPFSAQLRKNRLWSRSRGQKELATLFAAELAAADRSEQLLAAMVQVTSWASWSILRDDLDLDVPTATGVMDRTFRALLSAG